VKLPWTGSRSAALEGRATGIIRPRARGSRLQLLHRTALGLDSWGCSG
jgi:hypothetical protein